MTHAGWGRADLFSIGVAACILLLFMMIRPKHRTTQGITDLLAAGLTLGPLLLILADPITQTFGLTGSLLELVLAEGRATLWWAAAVAVVYIVRDLL